MIAKKIASALSFVLVMQIASPARASFPTTDTAEEVGEADEGVKRGHEPWRKEDGLAVGWWAVLLVLCIGLVASGDPPPDSTLPEQLAD